MDKNEVFGFIQKSVTNPPLILVGSGGSASHNLPGMQELGEHLIKSLNSKYKKNISWNKFADNLYDGQDLESALSKVSLDDEIVDDIRKETWKLISKKDIELLKVTSKNLSFQQKSCPEIGSYLKNSSKMVNEYAFRAV